MCGVCAPVSVIPFSVRSGDFSITEADGVAQGTKIIMYLKETESSFSSQSVVERMFWKKKWQSTGPLGDDSMKHETWHPWDYPAAGPFALDTPLTRASMVTFSRLQAYVLHAFQAALAGNLF